MSWVRPGTHSAGDNTFLKRVYASQSSEETKTLYDEWAASYDKDLASEDYVSPDLAVEAIVANLGNNHSKSLEILDAGCGTGLVGVCLAKSDLGGSGLKVDGLDLSQGMLDVARKAGVYRDLETADLTRRLEREDGRYDVVVCVGTLTQGHVGPKVLSEFVRVTKKGGLVVATVLDDIWESGGYKSKVEGLEEDGKVEVLGTEEFGIRKDATKGGRMVVLRKM